MVERFTHTLQLDVDQEKLARVLSVYLVLTWITVAATSRHL